MDTFKPPYAPEFDRLLGKLAQHTGNADAEANQKLLHTIFRFIRRHASFEEAIKFNDMLPLPLKALFLDGWNIKLSGNQPIKNIDELAEAVVKYSDDTISSPTEARQSFRKVIAFLSGFTTRNQMQESLSFLPPEFRSLLMKDPDLHYARPDTCVWLS
ncbi:MAG: DUF2267 domain-containing protein [Cyclobacteriaceae bacterium]